MCFYTGFFPSPFLPSSGLFLTILPSGRGLPAWGVSPASALPPPVPESPEAQGCPSHPPAAGHRLGLGLGSRGGHVSSGFRAAGKTVSSGVSMREGHTGNRPRFPQDKRLRCQVTRGEQDTHGSAVTFPAPTQPRAPTPPTAVCPLAPAWRRLRLSHSRAPASPGRFCGSQNQAQPRAPDSGGRVGVDKTASPEGSQLVAGVRTLSEKQ